MGSLGQDQGTNVLMVSLPPQGHINPMLKFAKRLMPKGIRVTFVTTFSGRDRLFATVTAGGQNANNSSIDMEFIPDAPGPENPKDEKEMLEFLRSSGHKDLSDLITELGTKKRFSCIISSPFTPWVPEVAFEHNIPCAMLWIQACAVFSIYYRHFTNSDPFPELDDPNNTVEIPVLPLLEVRDLPSFMLPTAPPHFYNLITEFVDCLEKVNWVMANSFYELEPEIVKSMELLKPVIPIGPLVAPFLVGEEEEDLALKSEDSCIEWLDQQNPSSVIYISFGSITESTETQITAIATALKNMETAFLWVIRPLERATGVGVLQEMVEDGVGKVVAWAQQERVLCHVAVSCFLTHCGWNSALETVAAGKPVVAYPSWTDQPTDARLLVDVFGIGVRMRNNKDGTLTAEEVERCLREVTGEGPAATDMKRKAAELSQAATKAVASGGSSSHNFERFVSMISEI